MEQCFGSASLLQLSAAAAIFWELQDLINGLYGQLKTFKVPTKVGGFLCSPWYTSSIIGRNGCENVKKRSLLIGLSLLTGVASSLILRKEKQKNWAPPTIRGEMAVHFKNERHCIHWDHRGAFTDNWWETFTYCDRWADPIKIGFTRFIGLPFDHWTKGPALHPLWWSRRLAISFDKDRMISSKFLHYLFLISSENAQTFYQHF